MFFTFLRFCHFCDEKEINDYGNPIITFSVAFCGWQRNLQCSHPSHQYQSIKLIKHSYSQCQQSNMCAASKGICNCAWMGSRSDDTGNSMERLIGSAPKTRFSGKNMLKSCTVLTFIFGISLPPSRCKAAVCTTKGKQDLAVISLEHNHMKKVARRTKGEIQKIKALRNSAPSNHTKPAD